MTNQQDAEMQALIDNTIASIINRNQAETIHLWAERVMVDENRIHELEAELAELKQLTRDYILDDLKPRVDKAREILEAMIESGSQLGPVNVQRALDALNGKR